MGMDFEIVKVTDLNEILDFGVIATPGLAVDGRLLCAGKVPTPEETKALFAKL